MNRLILETNRSFVKNQINKEVDKLFNEIKKLSLENEELKKDNKKLQENKTKLARAYARKIGLILTQKEYNKKYNALNPISPPSSQEGSNYHGR